MGLLLPIYMIHQVVPEEALPADTHLYITPSVLGELVRQLQWRGVEFVTLSDAWRRIEAGDDTRPCAVLTFDDLFDTFHRHALPVLQKASVPATGFVIGKSVAGERAENMTDLGLSSLTPAELREIRRAGIEIGSHALSHAELHRLPGAAVRAELAESRDMLSSLVDSPVECLCYPRGAYTERIARFAEEAGYLCACSTLRGAVQAPEDRWALKRIRVSQRGMGLRAWYTRTRWYDARNRRRRARDQARWQAEEEASKAT